MSENSSTNGVSSDENVQTTSSEQISNDNVESNPVNKESKIDQEAVHENSFKLDFRLLYDTEYNADADNLSYETIQTESAKICEKINKNSYQHLVKKISNSESKIRNFIKKFEAAHTFLIYFNLIDVQQKSKNSKKKKTENPRIEPSFLDNIGQMCIVLGDNIINYFSDNATIQTLKQVLDQHGLNFVNEKVTAVCFDAKQGYKLLKSCFDISDECLNKIFWHDVKTGRIFVDYEINRFLKLSSLS